MHIFFVYITLYYINTNLDFHILSKFGSYYIFYSWMVKIFGYILWSQDEILFSPNSHKWQLFENLWTIPSFHNSSNVYALCSLHYFFCWVEIIYENTCPSNRFKSKERPEALRYNKKIISILIKEQNKRNIKTTK